MTTFSPRPRIRRAAFDDGWVLEVEGQEQSHVDLADPTLIRFEYLRRIGNVLDLGWPPGEPLRVAHLGAGAMTLVRYVQATRPGSEQTVIELDAAVVKLVTAELPLPAGTQLDVITGDARDQLPALQTGAFDAIIVDIFTGVDTAMHLTDADFYAAVLQRLATRGLVMVNIGDDAGLQFFGRQAQQLYDVAVTTGLAGAWTLADASTLNRQLAGNAVLVAGGGLPLQHEEVNALRRRLTAAGPHPGTVLPPAETLQLAEYLRA